MLVLILLGIVLLASSACIELISSIARVKPIDWTHWSDEYEHVSFLFASNKIDINWIYRITRPMRYSNGLRVAR